MQAPLPVPSVLGATAAGRSWGIVMIRAQSAPSAPGRAGLGSWGVPSPLSVAGGEEQPEMVLPPPLASRARGQRARTRAL